jgi:hypothetical protein
MVSLYQEPYFKNFENSMTFHQKLDKQGWQSSLCDQAPACQVWGPDLNPLNHPRTNKS